MRFICFLLGHTYRPRTEVHIADTPEAFFAWNFAGHIARGGRYWFRARCHRCKQDEPYERTTVSA